MKPAKQLKYAARLISKLFSLKVIRFILVALLIIALVPVVFFVIFKPSPAKHINYGINFSNKYAGDLGMDWKKSYITILDELKPKYMRLVAYWDESEAVKDSYNYADIKWQLDQAKSRDIKVILTLGRKVPRFPECFEPAWWKDMSNGNLKDMELYEYLENTVKELKPYSNIYMWQVENEPFFPFGLCEKTNQTTVRKEIELVKNLDSRPILVQDSGEGGFWKPTYQMADYLGTSMYRRIWYDFWKLLLGKSVYFEYPLAHWSYKIKAVTTGVPMDKIIVTELQAEPWGPAINSKMSNEEKDKTMSKQQFLETINYAQKSGFENLYFWGVEWWLWEKEINHNSYYWETGKAVIQN